MLLMLPYLVTRATDWHQCFREKNNFSEYSEEHDSYPETPKITWNDKWKIVWREYVSPFHKS